jgi:hypothetical protein
MQSNYLIVDDTPENLTIRDIGPWDQFQTITNNAEGVVEELAPQLKGRRLLYIDSGGSKDELLVKDGQFDGFKML